jgi:hypothetical protein
LAVVVHGVLVFRLCECHLCFLNSECHVICEFVDQLQVRARLVGLKAHVRVPSGVEHEGGLLSQQVHTIVIVELA